MSTNRKRLAATIASALAAGGIAAAIALGAGGQPTNPVTTPTVKAAPVTSAATPATELQQADQTTPGAPAAPTTADPAGDPQAGGPDTAGEAPETSGDNTAAENAPEQVEADEPTLPGGGHQDPPGQNVDHQFEGVE